MCDIPSEGREWKVVTISILQLGKPIGQQSHGNLSPGPACRRSSSLGVLGLTGKYRPLMNFPDWYGPSQVFGMVMETKD